MSPRRRCPSSRLVPPSCGVPLLSLVLSSLALGTCTSPSPSCFLSPPTHRGTVRRVHLPVLCSSASTPPFSPLSPDSPLPPLEPHAPADDGLSPFLQDLVDSGTLKIVRRPRDYKETRERSSGGHYDEPLELFLLGTAHTSLTSAQQVEQLIHEVRPDAVVVELCKSRSAVVALNGSHLLEEDLGALLGLGSTNPDNDKTRSLRLAGGRGPLLLQWLLAFCVRALATKLKVTFGQEFKAARQAATQVGATLVLGDRPIELTMKRAWACMGPNERGALLVAALGLLLNIRELAAEDAKGKKASTTDRAAVLEDEARRTEVLRMLRGEEGGSSVLGGGDKTRQALQQFFPGLYGALIGERDAYLAWACKRSKAVSGAKRVVAVMGLLHLDGVEQQIKNDRAGTCGRELLGRSAFKSDGTIGDKLRFSTVARLPDPPAPSSPVSLTSEHALLIQHTAMLWLRNRGPGMVTGIATGAALGQVLGLLGPRVWEGMEQAGLANLPPLPFPF